MGADEQELAGPWGWDMSNDAFEDIQVADDGDDFVELDHMPADDELISGIASADMQVRLQGELGALRAGAGSPSAPLCSAQHAPRRGAAQRSARCQRPAAPPALPRPPRPPAPAPPCPAPPCPARAQGLDEETQELIPVLLSDVPVEEISGLYDAEEGDDASLDAALAAPAMSAAEEAAIAGLLGAELPAVQLSVADTDAADMAGEAEEEADLDEAMVSEYIKSLQVGRWAGRWQQLLLLLLLAAGGGGGGGAAAAARSQQSAGAVPAQAGRPCAAAAGRGARPSVAQHALPCPAPSRAGLCRRDRRRRRERHAGRQRREGGGLHRRAGHLCARRLPGGRAAAAGGGADARGRAAAGRLDRRHRRRCAALPPRCALPPRRPAALLPAPGHPTRAPAPAPRSPLDRPHPPPPPRPRADFKSLGDVAVEQWSELEIPGDAELDVLDEYLDATGEYLAAMGVGSSDDLEAAGAAEQPLNMYDDLDSSLLAPQGAWPGLRLWRGASGCGGAARMRWGAAFSNARRGTAWRGLALCAAREHAPTHSLAHPPAPHPPAPTHRAPLPAPPVVPQPTLPRRSSCRSGWCS
jgi:hypothetical protein